jgi:hypothetical protein
MKKYKVGNILKAKDFISYDYCIGKKSWQHWKYATLHSEVIDCTNQICEILEIKPLNENGTTSKLTHLLYFPELNITDAVGNLVLDISFMSPISYNNMWNNLCLNL